MWPGSIPPSLYFIAYDFVHSSLGCVNSSHSFRAVSGIGLDLFWGESSTYMPASTGCGTPSPLEMKPSSNRPNMGTIAWLHPQATRKTSRDFHPCGSTRLTIPCLSPASWLGMSFISWHAGEPVPTSMPYTMAMVLRNQ